MFDPSAVKSIFLAAIEKPPSERDAYLAQATGSDDALRERVAALLQAHEKPDCPLDAAAAATNIGADAGIFPVVAEHTGSLIGPYRLLQQIGEGGMGVVFMAEQIRPVQRFVALKIIKPGMDTRQVIARFEAERQALAMMDHPNIARVLDAGTTDTGRPYFVMELVKGIPITRYCDERRLSLRQRLELFKQVCDAVQHAHQKGIIHRDIKPSNVLVADYDDRAVPKIIDFGVAKATAHRLTEHTMFTELGQVIGTVEYMSPEQARFNQLDIDTRSDIYSLGVLLYELLTGSTPFERERLSTGAFDEVLRIIREEEPPKPSMKLSASSALPSIAASRLTEPNRLSKDIRGDLDWIVMKSLEKDRRRRYQTAIGLSDDVRRYLSDEPVEAKRPSRWYRFRKFTRRNKVGVALGATLVAALVIGLGAVSYFAAVASREAQFTQSALIKAERSRQEAERSRQEAEGVSDFFADEVFILADPFTNHGPGLTVLEALDIAAKKIDDKFPDNPAMRATLYARLSGCYTNTEQMTKGVEFGEKAVALLRQVYGENARETLLHRSYLGRMLSRDGRPDEGRALLEEVWATQRREFGDGDRDSVGTATRLAVLLMTMRPTDAKRPEGQKVGNRDLEVARQGYEAALRGLGPQHRATIKMEGQLSWVLRWHGNIDEALHYGQEAAELSRKVVGNTDTNTLYARYNYASCLLTLKRYNEAISEFQEIWEVRRRIMGPGHSDTLWAVRNLMTSLRLADKVPAAVEVLKDLSIDIPAIKTRKHTYHLNAIAEIARLLKEPAIAADFDTAAADAQ